VRAINEVLEFSHVINTVDYINHYMLIFSCQIGWKFFTKRRTTGSLALWCLGNSLRRPVWLHWCWRRL